MAEAAAATNTGATTAPQTTQAAPVASAGAALTPPSQINMQSAQWEMGFKNDELKSYFDGKKFTNLEQMTERYKNLEGMKGVPEERLLKIPEKMDGPEARIIWEKLGAPKDQNGYEFEEKDQDPQFLSWAKDTFFKNNLTKSQGQSMVKAYNDLMTKQLNEQKETRQNAILQADQKLKKEWGGEYETNMNLAKQGAKVLGLDAQTLDVIEALKGREHLFKTLTKIGVGVGESNFIDGSGQKAPELTSEAAQAEIKQLTHDRKFAKAIGKGDTEALAKWNHLHKVAFPGEKPIG